MQVDAETEADNRAARAVLEAVGLAEVGRTRRRLPDGTEAGVVEYARHAAPPVRSRVSGPPPVPAG